MKEIWEFDQWSIKHWEEVKNGNVDKTKSWVQLEDYEEGEFGERITIFTNQKAGFVLESQYDQWGIWYILKVGNESQTIAHELGTKSFLEALIAALTKLKEIHHPEP
jgi:hypothetical protein